jgi:hypothetical protein
MARKLPDDVLDYFRREGAKGGKARKKKLSAKELSEQGRKAVQARWAKKRATDAASKKSKRAD